MNNFMLCLNAKDIIINAEIVFNKLRSKILSIKYIAIKLEIEPIVLAKNILKNEVLHFVVEWINLIKQKLIKIFWIKNVSI